MKETRFSVLVSIAVSACLFAPKLAHAEDTTQANPAQDLEREYKRRHENREKYTLPLKQFEYGSYPYLYLPKPSRILPKPESADWKAIGAIITYEPERVLQNEEYENVSQNGRSFTPSWSKQQAGIVTYGLATMYKVCPKLFTRLGKKLVLKKVSSESTSENPARCQVSGNTLIIYSDFFATHKQREDYQAAAILNIGAALVANAGNTEELSNHPDWQSTMKRLQRASTFCADLFSAEDTVYLDHEISLQMVAPNFTASHFAKAALEQTLAKYLLKGAEGTPIECVHFLPAALSNNPENLQGSTFSQTDKYNSELANSPETFHRFALEVLSSTIEHNKKSRLFQMHLAKYYLNLANVTNTAASKEYLKEALEAFDDNLEETIPRSEQEKLLRASLLYRLGDFAQCSEQLSQMKQSAIVIALKKSVPNTKENSGKPNRVITALFERELKRAPKLAKLKLQNFDYDLVANAYRRLVTAGKE